jgi:hypothetical protein
MVSAEKDGLTRAKAPTWKPSGQPFGVSDQSVQCIGVFAT